MKYRLLFTGLVLLLGACAVSQYRYRFFTLGMEQGLTSDYAWSVCQDKYNYIWIGTQNGLNRYDGHNIRQYLHDPKDSFSIPGNSIYWIHRDEQGDLWFSLGYRGVAKYDYSKDRFEKFRPLDSIKAQHNYPAPVWRMGNDAQGRLYFACGAAVFRYTPRTGSMEDLTPMFKGAIEGHGVAMFVRQGRDTLWIITGNGLFQYNTQKEEIRHMPFDKDRLGYGTAEMHDGEFFNDHEMLISVSKSGYVIFNTRTEQFRLPPYPGNPTHPKQLSATGAVMKDSRGRIWLGNTLGGLMEYHPSANAAYSFKKEPSYPYPYAEQEGYGMNLYEDNQGNVWYCSSNKGVIWFKPETDFIQVFQRDFSKAKTLPDNNITYFLPLANDKMLVGTNRGVAELDTRTYNFTNYPVSFNEKGVYPHSFVRAMMTSGDSVLITTYQGLSILDRRNGQFSRFVDTGPRADSVFIYGMWLIHQLVPGEIIVTGNNVVRFNLRTRQYSYLDPAKPDPLLMLKDINATFYDKHKKTLWLEVDTGKLVSYNVLKRQLTTHVYTNDSVLMVDAIEQDETGKLWLGSTEGLYIYDPVSKKGQKVKLNTTHQHIYNIAIQNKEWAWLATPLEVVRYNRITGAADILPSNAFLSNSYIAKRAFRLDDKGFLWVGTNKGFCKIDLSRFETTAGSREPQIVNFSVFDQPKTFGKPYQLLDKIVLNHDENFFSFEVSSFEYDPHSAIEYSYLLEGFDKDWQTANGNAASYTNVPPGRYLLHLRSNRGPGGHMEKAKPVVVVIRPPFWQTWWFISALILATVMIAYGVYRFVQAKKSAERKAEQTAKESELQLLDIKKLLAESQLMALRAQMNPHFVFNCLNSIQECIVTQKYGEASLYLNKFSKLFRSVLHNSGKVLITLADEIEVLELYLSLEHMRFGKSFSYSIEVEEDMETDEILIPSMLLQPYVENALWHGLMHKGDNRNLGISFRKISEDVFQCEVDDDGIGRKKALELKEQQSKTKRHLSKGMSIAKDRIDLLQKQGHHAVLSIIDKHSPDGNPAGTKVVIELSAYLKA
ncbi:MAG TPA: histidine kinase [Chitinophagaceae bacterium]|nr:histidine kinase [Chitinophagaceae bacterium]